MTQLLLTYSPIVALILSAMALAVSCISLGWNIARDLILKARLRVHVAIKTMFANGHQSPPLVEVRGTNFGPGVLPCHMITGEHRTWWGGLKDSFIILEDNNLTPTTPLNQRTLQVGESVSYCLWLTADSFLLSTPPPTRIGISDRFGRIHWAKRKDLRDAIKHAHDWLPKLKKT